MADSSLAADAVPTFVRETGGTGQDRERLSARLRSSEVTEDRRIQALRHIRHAAWISCRMPLAIRASGLIKPASTAPWPSSASRARASWKGAAKQTANPAYQQLPKSAFEGYRQTRSDNCEVLAIIKDGQGAQELQPGDKGEIILDHTPFYAESGGQVGDRGWLYSDDHNTVVAEVTGMLLPRPRRPRASGHRQAANTRRPESSTPSSTPPSATRPCAITPPRICYRQD